LQGLGFDTLEPRALLTVFSTVNYLHELNVTTDGSDDIVVKCLLESFPDGWFVDINGNNPDTGPERCVDVKKIRVFGALSNNNIDLSAVNPTMFVQLRYAANPPVVISDWGGNNTIKGSQLNDSITGGSGKDTIYGEFGEDTIYGGSDDDYIDGGTDGDKIYGEDGQDDLHGGYGPGFDELHGGANNDYLDGGDGHDTLWGDGGQDVLHGGEGSDWLAGGDDGIVDYVFGEDDGSNWDIGYGVGGEDQ
jgi:Ca2+-binding RTX toxin-like protein